MTQPRLSFKSSVPLIAYHTKAKLDEKSNLMNDGVEMPPEKVDEANDPTKDETYYPYLKPELNLHVICDTTVYKDTSGIIPMVAHLFNYDATLGFYTPILYLSDFWVLMRDFVMMDQEGLDRIHKVQAGEKQEGDADMTEKEIEKLNFDGKVLLTWDNYSITYVTYQEQFKMSMKQQETMGLLKPSDYDEYKRIWLETDPILFTVTAIVSVLHSLFEFLAFKNDIQFWNGKEDVEGISVKTLYANIIMSLVITLYLFESETSLLILVP